MKITFFGHADFIETISEKTAIQHIFDEIPQGQSIEILLGGYGNFDRFAYKQSKLFQQKNANVKISFVTPYIDEKYQNNILKSEQFNYDEIIYPPLERVPKKFAISHRNRYMVLQADLIIVYINHSWGGAAQALRFAKSKNKNVINLAKIDTT